MALTEKAREELKLKIKLWNREDEVINDVIWNELDGIIENMRNDALEAHNFEGFSYLTILQEELKDKLQYFKNILVING